MQHCYIALKPCHNINSPGTPLDAQLGSRVQDFLRAPKLFALRPGILSPGMGRNAAKVAVYILEVIDKKCPKSDHVTEQTSPRRHSRDIAVFR
jgi:hypothetical protein